MRHLIVVFLFFAMVCANRIKIEVFVESLCPYCNKFETTSLKTALSAAGFLSMADVQIYPYGNAKETTSGDKYVYTCQHGAIECLGNLYETCAKYLLPIEDSHSFTICISSHASDFKKDPQNIASKCSPNTEAFNRIMQCAKSNEGNSYQHLVAMKTNSLKPPHKWVPWIVVDGAHDETKEGKVLENLLKYVCDNYQGEKIPDCNNVKKIETVKKSFVQVFNRCLRE